MTLCRNVKIEIIWKKTKNALHRYECFKGQCSIEIRYCLFSHLSRFLNTNIIKTILSDGLTPHTVSQLTWPPGGWPLTTAPVTLPPPAHQSLIISKQPPTQNIRIFYTAAHSWLFHNIFTRTPRKNRERDNRKEPGLLSQVSSLGVFLSTQSFSQMSFLPDAVQMKLSWGGEGRETWRQLT